MKTIISLSGYPNSGKTHILKMVYDHFKTYSSFGDISNEYVDDRNDDIRVVFEYKNVKIGLVSQGDYVRGEGALKNHLVYLNDNNVDLIVCACSLKSNKSINPNDQLCSFVENFQFEHINLHTKYIDVDYVAYYKDMSSLIVNKMEQIISNQ